MRKWLFTIIMMTILIGYLILAPSIGMEVFTLTFDNLKTMFMILPAIFVLVGLLDVWVSKETMIKFMGQDAGLKGYVVAFVLGTVAAGPLYAAFPVAAVLLKKKAHYRYVIFFLGTWSSLKVPQLAFQAANLGLLFTSLNVVVSIIVLLIGAFLVEKVMNKKDIQMIEERSSRMLK